MQNTLSTYGVISKEDITLYEKVKHLVHYLTSASGLMSQRDLSINSHTLVRVIVNFIPSLNVTDGSFVGLNLDESIFVNHIYIDHSWLTTPDKAIIEIFPVGATLPTAILLPTNGKSSPSWADHYMEDSEAKLRIQKEVNKKSTQEQVACIKKLIF